MKWCEASQIAAARVFAATGILILVGAAALPAQAPQRQTIPDEISCSTCRLALTPVVQLGSSGDSVDLAPFFSVARNSRGEFIASVSGNGSIGVFNSRGALVNLFGRRGNGPGEFSFVGHIAIGRADSLIIAEPTRRRIALFSPAGQFARTVSVAPHSPSNIIPNPAGGWIIRSPTALRNTTGELLHAFSPSGTLLTSFGGPTAAPDGAALEAISSPGRTGDAWVAERTNYMLRRWDATGRNNLILTRQAPWFQPWEETSQTDDRANRPKPRVAQVVQLDERHLAVILSVAARDWKPAPPLPVLPGGETAMPTNGPALFEQMIEIIDLQTNRVLLRENPGPTVWIAGQIAPGLVYAAGRDNDGNQQIQIYQLAVTR